MRTNVAAEYYLSIPAAIIAVSGAAWILAAIGQRRNATTLDIKEREAPQSKSNWKPSTRARPFLEVGKGVLWPNLK